MKKIFLTILFILTYNNIFSQQITYEIKDVKVDGVSIPSNGAIKFGGNSSVTVRFTVQFSKPNDLTIGDVSHMIGTQSPAGFIQLITAEFFNLGAGNTGFTGNWEKVLYANDYYPFGDNYLVAKLTQTSGNPPLLWESNHIPIIKEPTFSLYPTSLNIACGDTNSKSFAVTSSNIPSGTSVTYQWNYNGWSGSSSPTMASIILYPLSGTTLPSSVSVTPYINGVAQTSLTCYVTRATFSSAATITGASNICSGTSTYPISGILPGQTVTWSLSNPSIATLSGQSNSQTNVTFNGNGAQTLNAAITNTCGQVTTKSFQINTGVTTFTSAATIAGVTSLCSGQSTYTITGITTGQNVTWGLSNPSIATLSGATNSQVTVTFTGSGTQTLSAYITNSCGQKATKTFSIYGGIPVFNNFTYGTSTSTQSICLAGPSSYAYSIPELNATDKIFANFSGLSTAQAGLASNWQWTTSSNIIILNGTKNTRNMCTLAPGTANINVRVKNSCGYSSWAILPVTITELPIVSGRLSKATVFKVYPNPSSDIVNIELKDQNNQPSKETTITGELFDIMGQSKTKIQIIDNKATLSVRGFNKGIYVLKIYINDQIESYQIAVE